jgi:peptidoglycan/LPS O-acetylase OafA/YrhL
MNSMSVNMQSASRKSIAIANTSTRVHVPALDKLRGLAILVVILFHTLPTAPDRTLVDRLAIDVLSLGWAGVDLFFVLSGFLITGILIDERSNPHYFRTFFARRVLRIVPVYIAFLLFSMWIAPAVGASTAAAALRLRELQGWYWPYLTNIYIALHGWDAAADGTSHLWSLAVEEQFYLLWPVAVLLIPLRSLPRVALGCVAVAELCRIAFVLSGAIEEVNFVLLPTRMDALAVGAFLACAVRSPDLLARIDRWRNPILGAALLALMAAIVVEHALDFRRPLTQILAFPAIAILSGALVLEASRNRRWFSALPLQFLGKYSYGMYIWHIAVMTVVVSAFRVLLPMVVVSSSLVTYTVFIVLVLASTIVVSLLSWYVIEQPFLRLKRFVRYE